MDHQLITHYFPHLTDLQQQQLAALHNALLLWNDRINVISRKDIDHLYLRHVLHSLSIAKYIDFGQGARVWDVGTGGGFPGIPLAILFPETQFFLCDSIAKKIFVVKEVVTMLGLTNVLAKQVRAEEVTSSFDYALTRAVAPLDKLVSWVQNKTDKGLICLKGGNLDMEVEACVKAHRIKRDLIDIQPISQWFTEPFFEEKKIVHIRICKLK
ncbi:MAG: 16S rRNA (guanine(527)-N(7))-methyltransferase RsmG [Prevotellaceae bacterium]|jgi:16S rRNA (guanine527-N7)-methyltransferase|nr:16S rRNA (guanine(527)-N(7))-methyltransferase RsmG [Prevotellaceae bacterium]